jgi:YidC/Oxa1 family membrane protein insertase
VHPITAALVWLCGPLLLVLHKLHRVGGSWGLAILLLLVLVKSIGIVCGLLIPGKKAREQIAKERAVLEQKRKTYAVSDYVIQDVALRERLARLSWHLPIIWVLGQIEFLSRFYAYLGLYVILLFTGDLRGARMGWIPDLTQPDPSYLLPLLVCVYWVVGALVSMRKPDARKPNRLVYVMLLAWVGLNALLPAGGCMYHLASCLFTPVAILLTSLAFLVWQWAKGLAKN